MHKFYRLHDWDPKSHPGVFEIAHAVDAPEWNKKGFGIFWTIQEFNGPRKKENLSQINGFAVDIDKGTKEEQLERIRKALYPTWIIETARGFHVYWLFKEPMVQGYSEELEQDYRGVMATRLVPFFEADEKAQDLCRILRAPYFLHQKNKEEPFMVKVYEENEARYKWDQIERFFPDEKGKKEWKKNIGEASKILRKDGRFFDRIYDLNCKEALESLSGHSSVNGERFTFRRTGSGNHNIFVNGKSTSCWIDRDGKIGSFDKGGPTVWQWLYWYSRDHKKVYSTIKEVFRGICD